MGCDVLIQYDQWSSRGYERTHFERYSEGRMAIRRVSPYVLA